MRHKALSYGYYHVTFSSPDTSVILYSNNERAFVIAQLQDLLSPRLLIGDIPAHKQLASCIDLLAFSIQRSTIQLIVFSIDEAIITYLAHLIAGRLAQYRSEHPRARLMVPMAHITTCKLRGVHQALAHTIELHLSHDDWEYDRYSSIGFYLHDRRGDWMRTWRLTQLFENDSELYRHLIYESLRKPNIAPAATAITTPQPFAP